MGIVFGIGKVFRFAFGSKLHLKHKSASTILFDVISFI
jgi:hypothetical protein